MQQLSKEAVSTLFSVQEDEAESDSDFSMDFSLDSDPLDWGNYTSTPIKLDGTTNLGSDTSSLALFSGPSFSLIEDLDDSELPSLHESINEMTGTQISSNLPSQPQNNSNNSIQPQQISFHYSQPNANGSTPQMMYAISRQPEASVNAKNRPDQISTNSH